VARGKRPAEREERRLQLFFELAEVEDGPLMLDCVTQWHETGNAYFMLYAVRYCARRRIPVAGVLLTEAAEAARALETDCSHGGPAKVANRLARTGALRVMELLRFTERNLPIEEAAELARVWLRTVGFVRASGKPPFATDSLVRWYPVRGEPYRFRVIEDELKAGGDPLFGSRLFAALKGRQISRRSCRQRGCYSAA